MQNGTIQKGVTFRDEWRPQTSRMAAPFTPFGAAISLPTTNPQTEHAIYALSGQKVNAPDRKGIYIQDGKKVLR